MKLRVGIVGCGHIIDKHVAALRKIKDVKLVAACDLNKELANQAALKYGIDKSYSDFSELLFKEKPDIVHVVTPPQTHMLLSIQAMEAGCHVLVEKPLALSIDDADKMIESARKNNVILSVVHNNLFMPAVIKAKSLIQSSKIGELLEMQIVLTGKHIHKILDPLHWYHQLPGGVFGETLPHPLYIAESFLGDLRIVKVNSLKFSTHEWLKADEVRIMLENSTCTASVTCSLNVPSIWFINFIGTKGYLHVSIARGVAIIHFPADRFFAKGLDNLWTSCQWTNDTICVAIKHIFNRYHDGHYHIIKRFVDALQKGDEPAVSLETARKVTKLYQEVTNLIPNSK